MENEGRVIGLVFPEVKEEPKPKDTEPAGEESKDTEPAEVKEDPKKETTKKK